MCYPPSNKPRGVGGGGDGGTEGGAGGRLQTARLLPACWVPGAELPSPVAHLSQRGPSSPPRLWALLLTPLPHPITFPCRLQHTPVALTCPCRQGAKLPPLFHFLFQMLGRRLRSPLSSLCIGCPRQVHPGAISQGLCRVDDPPAWDTGARQGMPCCREARGLGSRPDPPLSGVWT